MTDKDITRAYDSLSSITKSDDATGNTAESDNICNMNGFRRKYFFFDIDGTLAVGRPGKYIPESAIRTLRELESKGHFTSIATGRSHHMAQRLLEESGMKNMISDGGNGIYFDGRLIEILPLDKELLIKVADELDEKSIPWSVSLDDSNVRYCKDESFMNITDDRYMKSVIYEGLDLRTVGDIYKMYIFLTKEEESTLKYIHEIGYSRFRPDFIFIEQTDKSVGIRKMMEMLDAPLEDVVVFGDEMNDFKMFRPEWTSIAMGDASEGLKAVASFVTKNAEDDGIEFACKHFGWID